MAMQRQVERRLCPPVLFAFLLAVATAAAQSTEAGEAAPAAACDAVEHHQFDFWIGEWEVRSPEGELAGHNSIRRIAGSCGLLEDWHGADGSAGMSINAWDAGRGAWTQRWVGAGSILWIEGKFDGERMTLSGPRRTRRGEVLDRITWTPLADGGVRQHWEVSADGGRSWTDLFVGVYFRAEPADGGAHRTGNGRDDDD
ncbi:MAG: hypothetical protein ACREIV_15955 [Planctomycetaceae bacterium]